MIAPSRRPLAWLVVAAAIALGWGLGGHRLLDPDEGRNAEVAREMAQSNDYLLPHLDGLPYLDKPVVYFAAAAAAMEVLGPGETAARLPAYLATLATLGVILSACYALWLYRKVVFGALVKPSLASIKDLTFRESLTLMPLVFLTILFGIYPKPVLDMSAASVQQLVNNYNTAVTAVKAAALLP